MKKEHYAGYYEYLESDGVKLFTIVALPEKPGKFPIILERSPYVDETENMKEEEIVKAFMEQNEKFLAAGYAIVFQHCRGRGKSEGDCIPYINERRDGLKLQEWVRMQPFYDGEIFLMGASYTTSVHYATAPFADDIKGAIFSIQDTERYNLCYRNGIMKMGLLGIWYVDMYKAKSHMKKNCKRYDGDFSMDAANILPFSEFSNTVFGERSEEFDEMIKHPDRTDEFWNSNFGGGYERDAVKNVKFPVLLETGFYDLYTSGIFTMWNSMNEESRKNSALVVSPYDHGDGYWEDAIAFPEGKRKEAFGEDYEIKWFDYIRGKEKVSPFEQGKVTYYRLFENRWSVDEFKQGKERKITFGTEQMSYVYNPYDPPKFKDGLSGMFGGVRFQDAPNSRYDIVSVYSAPFEEDTFIKGKMRAKLHVKTDCEDTCFYVRLSITKEQGDYGLRDDITTVCGQHEDYKPNEEVSLDFCFDEHAFLVKKGERIRMDVASACAGYYIRHTNTKGLFSEQCTAKIAHNTVYFDKSYLMLPVE